MNDVAAVGPPPVLVVDDDLHVRQVVQWALEDAGFTVVTAADGEAALVQAAICRPRVVVLDFGLPNADGVTVAAQLRSTCGSGLSIMLITADGRAAEKAARVGAYAYLHKPFEDRALVATVLRGLGG